MTDFSVTTTTPEEAPTAREIGISGAMTIHHACEIRTAMLDTLAEANEVRLDLKKVTDIDLAGLQLIGSFHKAALVAGKGIKVSGMDSAVINPTTKSAGFIRHTGCALDTKRTCVWVQGGN